MDEDMMAGLKKLNTFFKINAKGLLRKKLSFLYQVINQQEQLVFRSDISNKLSFTLHDLELNDAELSGYWHAEAQKEKPVTFKGTIHRLYNMGIGDLRGYLSTAEESRRLGVIVKDHRVQEFLREDLVQMYITSQANKMCDYVNIKISS